MTDDSLRAFQAHFARGLLGAGQAQCETDFGGGYAVHARNVRTSLQIVLDQVYPVVQQLVGADFFTQATRAFVTVAPPRQGWLSAYGNGFPGFLATYEPASTLPYLRDLACVEWGRVAAAFGDVVAVLDLGALAALGADDLMERSLCLHPGATLIRSAYPVYSIWAAHLDLAATSDLLADISLDHHPEDLLITRAPAGEASVRRLGLGEAAFLSALTSGTSLGSAWHQALHADPQFKLPAVLAGLIAEQALIDHDPGIERLHPVAAT